jgi:hypothetical protein
MELEPRCLLTGGPTITVPLDPTLDQFGDQIVTVMTYTSGAPDPTQQAVGTFGIFDSGASAVTFSPDDASLFDFFGQPIGIKNPGGAVAGGIGGEVTGDVSEPGYITADGMHASSLSFTSDGFPNFGFDFTTAASTPGIQTFVGTTDGSPDLPTITGTPLLHPSATNPNGLAALVNMQGETLDFSDIAPGLVLQEPDIHFVSPTTTLTQSAGATAPATVPLTFYGNDNYSNPGDLITDTHLTTQNDVTAVTDPQGNGNLTTAAHQHFLFDTGSQLTVISTALATQLGLDLNHPETTIDVQGVGGNETVPGYTIHSITLPTTAGGSIVFTDVPVYVLDVADDIDGILGMNLLDTADQFLYNPSDPTAGGPTVTYSFLTNPDRGGLPDGGNLSALFDQHGLNFFAGAFAGHALPEFGGSTLQFAASTSSVNESAGAVAINVDRTGNLSAAQTVHFTTANGSAKAGVNYSAASGDLHFAPGQKTAVIAVPVHDDQLVDGNLNFQVTLSQATGGASLGTHVTSTVTIHNTDTAGTIQFSNATYAVNENAGSATITVTRIGGSAAGVSVVYTTMDGSAKSGQNYTSTTGTLTFGAGETSKTFTVPVLDDQLFSSDKALVITLSQPNAGAALGGPSTATLLIHETDPAPVPLVTIAGVQTSTNRRGQVTGITVVLSAPVAPASVANSNDFQLIQAGRKGRFDTRDAKRLALRPAVYSSGSVSISLTPKTPVALNRPVELVVSGLIDLLGRPFDSQHNGQAGGSFVVLLHRGVSFAMAVAHPKSGR